MKIKFVFLVTFFLISLQLRGQNNCTPSAHCFQAPHTDCPTVSEPDIWDDDCGLGLSRYLSRSANADGLWKFNREGSGPSNCTPPYSADYRYYCEAQYCAQIQSFVDLDMKFIARASSAWRNEWGFKEADPNDPTSQDASARRAMEQLVCDVNEAYDCAGKGRPIIQAGIFEGVDPVQVSKVFIDEDVFSDFFEFSGLSYCDLEARHFVGDVYPTCCSSDNCNLDLSALKNPYTFVGDEMFEDDKYDLTKIETQLWFFYQAKSYMDMGYTSLHMGHFEAYAENDDPPNYPILNNLLESFRKYAQNEGTFMVMNGEGGNPKIGDSDKFMFEFGSVPMRIRELIDPSNPDGGTPNGDLGCNDQIDISNTVFSSPACAGVDLPAIIDPCVILNYMGSDRSGISPLYGADGPVDCYTEEIPVMLYFDFGHGAWHRNDCAIAPEVGTTVDDGNTSTPTFQYTDPDGNIVSFWGGATYGYDDARWFVDALDDDCKFEWWSQFYCNLQGELGNVFMQVPGQLRVKLPELAKGGCGLGFDGYYLLSDNPGFQDDIEQFLAPNPVEESDVTIIEECSEYRFAKCRNYCQGEIAPYDKKWKEGRKRVTVKINNTDCSSIYSIHVFGPNGWLPHVEGTEYSFFVPTDGNYEISIRQDNLALDETADPNRNGTRSLHLAPRYFSSGYCCILLNAEDCIFFPDFPEFRKECIYENAEVRKYEFEIEFEDDSKIIQAIHSLNSSNLYEHLALYSNYLSGNVTVAKSNPFIEMDIEYSIGDGMPEFISYREEAKECIPVDYGKSSSENREFEGLGLNDILTVNPNPASEEVIINFNLDKDRYDRNAYEIRLTDLLGRNLKIFKVNDFIGKLDYNISNLPEGIYLVNLFEKDLLLKSVKIVIAR